MSFLITNEESFEIAESNNAYELKQSTVYDEKSLEQSFYQKSLIGRAVSVKGDLNAKEDILIDGSVDGSINLKHHRLEIGVTGVIKADAFARVIVINGEMKGDVYARDQVIVTKTGRVNGNIFAGDIHIEDGAILKGSVNMDMQDVVRDHFNEEDYEETVNKGSSFGFLFKKSKSLPQIDANNNYSQADESLPVTLNQSQACAMLDRSVIGKTVVIKGQLEADEDVLIQGEVDGVIHFKNNNLELGHQARICANIFVNSLVTYGDIKGDVYASEHVALKKPGHVFGTVRSPRVSIESGAVLMGNIEMEQQDIEKIFANIDVASALKPKAKQNQKRVMQQVDDEKYETVSADQYSVSNQKHSAKAKRAPWQE